MTSFEEIVKESNKLLKMQADLTNLFFSKEEGKQSQPCVAAPAIETKQGEQKSPVVKPNGVNR